MNLFYKWIKNKSYFKYFWYEMKDNFYFSDQLMENFVNN